MDKLFTIEAEISIYSQNERTWPIKNGYRPGFNFIGNQQTSGSIKILNQHNLKPGEQGIVEISFISKQLLGDVNPGTEFKFYEGPVEIGNGKVLKILGWIVHR